MFVAGAVEVQWLRDELGIIQNAAESGEPCGSSVPDSAGVVVVPAFTGPRRTILGLRGA